MVAAVALGLAVVAGALPALANENVTLRSNLDQYSEYADIWGYESGGVELAILGTTTGTSFVDVTNPDSPVEVEFIPGTFSFWRDIKTWDQHAYIVNEDGGGLQIVDLTDPLNPSLVGNRTDWFSTAHNIYIDLGTGYAYCVGANTAAGAVVLDLANPTNPSFLAFFNDYYIHDIYVENGIAYAAAISNDFLGILDVSDPLNIQQIANAPYAGSAATHNTWTTEDGNYCLTTDETSGGHIRVWDIQTLTAPTQVGDWLNPEEPNSSVHNVIVHDGLAFAAWYTAGLQILDLTNPASPQRVGWYDTHPSSNGFNGAWGVYPFASSGNIYVSDIQTGLYVFTFTPTFGSVAGTITDATSGDPLEGVTVEVLSEGISTTTNASGYYKINLDPGSYTVEVSAFGYEPESVPVSVNAGVTENGDLALTALPSGSLAGQVLDANTLTPLAGASIVLGGTPLNTTSDGGGGYDFASVPAGDYTVSVALFGYGSRDIDVTVSTGANLRNLLMTPALFADDVESNQGWTTGVPGDDATTGLWLRADPVGTQSGTVQPEDDHTPAPGTDCFVTGNTPPGGEIGDNDVDGGTTTLLSPVFDLSDAVDPYVSYYRWYVNDAGANPGEDDLVVEVSTNAGSSWVTLETLGETRAFWERHEVRLLDLVALSSQVQFRFIAFDSPASGSIVEAAIDDFELYDKAAPVSDVPETPGAEATFVTRFEAISPNPLTGGRAVRFSFQLGAAQAARFEVIDVAGRRVWEYREALTAGPHAVAWAGRDHGGAPVPAGIYFVRFRAGEVETTRKLVMTGR